MFITGTIMKDLYFSCPRFTVLVVVDENNMIRETSAITRKFIGQPLDNLKRWAGKFGKVTIEPLNTLITN